MIPAAHNNEIVGAKIPEITSIIIFRGVFRSLDSSTSSSTSPEATSCRCATLITA